MYKFLRPLLFQLYPETAQQLTLQALRLAGHVPPASWLLTQFFKAPAKPVQAFGLTFKNPVGLAAGYDKNAVAIKGLAALGLGHMEVGTITPRPQPGNPKPRVFRLIEDEAVINRLGFPSPGMSKVESRMSKLRGQRPMVIGINLGKNKDTPLEEAANDYTELMRRFMFYADYLTINISSPNTVGLRRLQGREMLEQLLGAIQKERESTLTHSPSPRGRGGFVPILVKIAPDLNDEELVDAVGVILDKGMDGIIATNTTLARDGLRSRHQGETGGLSGSPLRGRSEAVLSRVVKLVDGKVPIVSVGGILNPDDAKKRLALGASLVQVYTGMIYRGPQLIRQIVKSL
ncbi:MAG: quinone-dependent dihydroorotate dehydrogenase [Chloroflexota bacterium]